MSGCRCPRASSSGIPCARVATVSTIVPLARDVAQVAHELVLARVVRLVAHEQVGDLEDPRLVHLHRVAHAGREHDRVVSTWSRIFTSFCPAPTVSTNTVSNASAPSQAPADQLDDLVHRVVVLAPDRQRPVEDLLAQVVEVHPQAVAQQRPPGDRALGVERDDRAPADRLPASTRRACSPTSWATSVLLPAPGEPVIPITRFGRRFFAPPAGLARRCAAG
jgi:hypothetical protein